MPDRPAQGEALYALAAVLREAEIARTAGDILVGLADLKLLGHTKLR
jgi:hypothetical protein